MKQLLLALVTALMLGVPSTVFSQNNVVRGRVTNESGEPLSAVTIQVKGTTRTTLSGADGSFTIDAPRTARTLVISYVGMESQEVSISGSNNLQVALKSAESALADVVVVGYGVQRKANLTGSVATVT